MNWVGSSHCDGKWVSLAGSLLETEDRINFSNLQAPNNNLGHLLNFPDPRALPLTTVSASPGNLMLGKHCTFFIIVIFHAQTSLGNAGLVRSMGTVASCGVLRNLASCEINRRGFVNGWRILIRAVFSLRSSCDVKNKCPLCAGHHAGPRLQRQQDA